jgi:hypothetical protein
VRDISRFKGHNSGSGPFSAVWGVFIDQCPLIIYQKKGQKTQKKGIVSRLSRSLNTQLSIKQLFFENVEGSPLNQILVQIYNTFFLKPNFFLKNIVFFQKKIRNQCFFSKMACFL